MPEFLHARRDFGQLVSLIASERGIDPVLVEKDYWLMHCLWGLQAQGLRFELKGETSLAKGFGIICRFSEDIDIRIEPPAALGIKPVPPRRAVHQSVHRYNRPRPSAAACARPPAVRLRQCVLGSGSVES